MAGPTLPFRTVLVANRGEIAVRVIRTLHRLGIRSAAVYSDADRGAPHVAAADVAVRLGPTPPAESYLHLERLMDAAGAVGADALHPGYGFLAENPALATACDAAGVAFVGPPATAVAVMGDKIRAKQTVAAAGVDVVPGRTEPGMTDDDLAAAAHEIGFPVLLKPAAGGGGKGMRLVTEPDRLEDEIAAARREAQGAFGDGELLVERFVHRPRHIEVQVLADAHGAVVHLGERECSLQRRHQKVVEEAPSPLLDDAQRAAFGERAVAVARACGYVNAGTVELIVSADEPDRPYFLEMNTRLQVEHPVTEMAWGVDLVELQLRVAAGEPLPFAQGDLVRRGHAVEARIYAEDPARGFLPTGGTVRGLVEPAGDGVRVDSGIAPGSDVVSAYDPMLAKVIAWGEDRAAALARLDRALAGTAVLGVTTNVGFLRRLLAHPDVAAGRLDTGLIDAALDDLITGAPTPSWVLAAAALADLVRGGGPARDRWQVPDGWRVGPRPWVRWRATTSAAEPVEVELRPEPASPGGPASWTVRPAADPGGRGAPEGAGAPDDGAATATLDVHDRGPERPSELAVTVGGITRRGWTVRSGPTRWVAHEGEVWSVTDPEPVPPGGGGPGRSGGEVRSPMPGTVVAVAVADGDEVEPGTTLVVVEAMKMEHALAAPHAGTVAVHVTVGQRVALDEVLATVDDAPAG